MEKCSYFEKQRCRSCSLLGTDGAITGRLPELPDACYEVAERVLPWVRCSSPFHSRTKARMVVSGSVSEPIVGILDEDLKGISLLSCPLHKNIINTALSYIPTLITEAGVEPYQIHSRSGQLKYVILQTNRVESHLKIRFVLSSRRGIESCRYISSSLEKKLSTEVSSSVNIQPIPHQIPEGEEEIHLGGERYLWESYPEAEVAFPAKSFMQVTPEIACKLYDTVTSYVKGHTVKNVLDLFCGAGGFSLSVSRYVEEVRGIEISPDAVEAAQVSAARAGASNTSFHVADLLNVKELFQKSIPDLIICNPPRRGLGDGVTGLIKEMLPETILYSSCNSVTFMSDFEKISSFYSVREITPFEMFPLTSHFELLAVLESNTKQQMASKTPG